MEVEDRRPLLRSRSGSGPALHGPSEQHPPAPVAAGAGAAGAAAAGAAVGETGGGLGEGSVRRRPAAAATAHGRDHAGGDEGPRDSRFECNICLDSVNEPVVTRCGHLFCWPCLYRWLNTNHTECPVCKAGVSRDNVIPLYGRGQDPVDPRTKQVNQSGESIPERPTAERPRAERPRAFGTEGFNFGGGGNDFAPGSVTFTAGFGFFPSLFGLQFQTFTSGTPSGAQPPADAADAAQQALLSRMLLTLGSFVVLCLLLF